MSDRWRQRMAGARRGDSASREVISAVVDAAPTALDLTDPTTDEVLEAAADLLAGTTDAAGLAALDVHLAETEGPLAARLAAKLAMSKLAIRGLPGPIFLSVVFAVYQEHQRILSSGEHPDGEDFLNRKLRQLEWLFDERRDAGFEAIVVDDGCPDGSGRIAADLIVRGGHRDRARVLFLEDAIAREVPVVAGMRSTAESRKGGSILLGMWDAIQAGRDGHFVLFTDADLSTHLGQSGLLLEALAAGASCAAGSRREPTSAVVKATARNDRGKLFIYLWKRLLEPLGEIVDTQCGFKAFPAAVVADIVGDNDEWQFAFDIELLLRTQLGRPGGITRVPVAWIDSEAQSTTTDLQPYVAMLQSIARMYRRYLPANATADEFAGLIDQLDQASWERLLAAIPPDITTREPGEFATFDGVGAARLAEAAGFRLPG